MLKNLKTIRELRGLSQKDLGDLIGVEQQTISGYESDGEPSCEMLILLAKHLDTSTDYLLGIIEDNRRSDVLMQYRLNNVEDHIVREFREQNKRNQELISNSLDNIYKIIKNK